MRFPWSCATGAAVVLVMALAAVASAGEWVADNDAGWPVYSETGSWTTSISTGYAGGSYRYVVAPGPLATATWRPVLPATTTYTLYAAFRTGSNRPAAVPLTIVHAGGVTTATLNQQGSGTVEEVPIGEFVFEAGTSGSVTLSNTGSAGAYIADAFLWKTPTDPPPVIQAVTRSPIAATSVTAVLVTARITDNDAIVSAALRYSVAPSVTSNTVMAFDDGVHGDGAPADGVFGAAVPALPNNSVVTLRYHAWDSGGNETASPPQYYVVGRQAGHVYVVLSSDTSVWGFSSGPNPVIPWTVFESRSGAVAKTHREAFRTAHTDGSGRPFCVTWFMHGGAWFRASGNSTPISATHHIRKNWGAEMARWGDTLEYHFHHYVYTTDWVMAPTFAETIWEYEWVMSQMMLEENLFIAAFRSGWNYMDNPYQQYLERWVPFRMEGTQTNWVPYHPSAADWRVPGTMKGWEVRHVYMKSLSAALANQAFGGAEAGADQVMCIWSHQNETDFPDQIALVDERLRNAAAAYPAVQWHYCSAREAMRRYMRHDASGAPPPLAVAPQVSGDTVSVTITTADNIFQEQPWVAARRYSGECVRLDTVKTGPGMWQFTYSRSEYDRVTVGVCDLDGNDALVEVPDGTHRWAGQADFWRARPMQVDVDSTPSRAFLAKAAGGGFVTTGSLTFDRRLGAPGEWRSLQMAGTVPAGTDLRLRYKTAATLEQLDAAPWSVLYGAGSLAMLPGTTHAYLRIEVLLDGNGTASPSLQSLEVEYGPADARIAGKEWRLY